MVTKAQVLLAALVLMTGLFGLAKAEDCVDPDRCTKVNTSQGPKQLPPSGGGNGPPPSPGGSSGQPHLINKPTQNKPFATTVNPTLQGNALQKSNGLLTKPIGGYDLKANKGR